MVREISITIVVYRNYSVVKDAIISVVKNTKKEFIIYVIDNSNYSDQGNEVKETAEFVEWLNNYDYIKYVAMNKNVGFGKGHNYVIPMLKSKYHVIMNPDIIFCDDVLSSIITFMDTNMDIGMVIPNIVDMEGNRQQVYRKELTVFDLLNRTVFKNFFKTRAGNHILCNEDFSKPFQVPFGQGSFLVIRTELFKKLNGFDDNFFMYVEDADLCKRVNNISRLVYYPGAKVIHLWKKESHKNIRLMFIHLKSIVYYFKKWGLTFW